MTRFFAFTPALIAAALVPAAASAQNHGATATLVDHARERAAWSGVEVERIVQRGDSIVIEGVNRLGSHVTIVETCAEAKVDCAAALAERRADQPVLHAQKGKSHFAS